VAFEPAFQNLEYAVHIQVCFNSVREAIDLSFPFHPTFNKEARMPRAKSQPRHRHAHRQSANELGTSIGPNGYMLDGFLGCSGNKAVTVLWVAIGSALGGAGRYWAFEFVTRQFGDVFPWGTLLVNVSGSVLVGVLATMTGHEGRFPMGPTANQFLLVGVFGGFTTFSAFSLQTLRLIQEGDWWSAAGNVIASVSLCLIGVWAGHTLAVALNR
jgi:CrcB protein